MSFAVGDRVKIVESNNLLVNYYQDGNVGKILSIHEMRKGDDIAIVDIENSGRAYKIPVTELVKIEELEKQPEEIMIDVTTAFGHLTAERLDELIEAMIVIRVSLFGEPEDDD